MAENTIDIAGASQDLQTIEDFVNLPADSEVYPRLLPSVNVGTLAGARQAIFEAGGLPATPFATKALMTASALVDNQYAMVTDDTVNNGLYVKTAGAWVKSAYDPLPQSKAYTDTKFDQISVFDDNLLPVSAIIPSIAVVGATGAAIANAEYESTPFIAVKKGDKIKYQGKVSGSIGIAAYNQDKVFVKRIYDWATDGDLPNNTLIFEITDESVKFIRASNKHTLGVTLGLSLQTPVITKIANVEKALQAEAAKPISMAHTINLLDGVTLLTDKAVSAISGAIVTVAGYESTPLLPVGLGDDIKYTGAVRGEVGIAGYDAVGTFIEKIYNPDTDADKGILTGSCEFTITNPLIKNIRACNRLADAIPMTIVATKKYTGADIYKAISAVKNDIIINFVSSTKFVVQSITQDNSFVSHYWEYWDRPEFAEQGWFATECHHNSEYFLQGNYNAIHIMLDGGAVDDAIFVGLGHGCETMRHCEFFIDGEQFDPHTATASLSGKEFKVQSVSDIYKPDRALTIATHGNTNATMPAQPLEIRSRRVAQMTIAGNNRIEREQKLHILKNNVKFNVLFGAMQRTTQPLINGVVSLNDKDGIRNHFPDLDTNPMPLAPSTIRLGTSVNYGNKNCFATRFTALGQYKGYSYNITTFAKNSDSSKLNKNYVQMWLADLAGSNKVYFHPIYTTALQTAYPEFVADVFNSGDVIEMESTTEINVSRI